MTGRQLGAGLARLVRRWAAAGAVGYIVVFYGEMVFWGRLKTPGHLAEYPATWLVYSLAAFAMLTVASVFRARGWHAFFLCGAIFGWLIEGIVVQTVYEDLPVSLSITGLSWHASISVMLGWWLMSRLLASGQGRRVALLCVGLGLFFGTWAVCWWYEENDVRTPLEFMRYALGCGAPLILAHAVWHRGWWTRPSRIEMVLFSGFVLLVFFTGTVPAAPLALPIAPVLFGISLLALWRMRRRMAPDEDGALEELDRPARPAHLLLPALIPVVAIGVYTAIHATGLRPPTHQVIYIVTLPIGFGLYGWAQWRAWRGDRRAAE